MAAGTHSPGGPNGIIRSQSFAGFSTLQERRSRCNSFMGNSVVQKKSLSRPRKSQAGGKASSSSRDPQPRRVEEIHTALKLGLDEYLEVHQAELDKLSGLMRDMKRNSRLGVLYDLDKQIKTIERFMRRLEFHMSKVDELYEAFCIQRRLREGASRMQQAFSSSPSTKATRSSTAEVTRRYKEYTENMSTFEGELENLLGEFHIKMKGLAGFARLCPGDQYEIFMRYGRQRWKLKGRIEVNSRQSWDGEEVIFTPLISDLINIKVTELKGLATHILVGSVICETKELFTAMPQVVAVDVNDLGTIKLNLEVTWFPFDVEDLSLSSGNVSKASAAVQRRVSVYSQGTPETPTFQEQSFFSTLPDELYENGSCKRLSFSPSEGSGSTPSPGSVSGSTPSPSPAPSSTPSATPEITVTPPETDTPPRTLPGNGEDRRMPADVVEEEEEEEEREEEEEDESGGGGSANASLASDEAESEWERTVGRRCRGDGSGSASLCSEGGVVTVAPEDVFLDQAVVAPDDADEPSELKPVELEAEAEEKAGSLTRQLVRRLTSSEVEPLQQGVPGWAGEGSRAFLDSSLEEAIQTLLLRLEGLTQRCRELQDLEQEVMRLEDLLKCRLPGGRSRSSSLSLTVESALESFDFLNTSDFDDEDTGDDALATGPAPDLALPRSAFLDMEADRTGPGQHPEARGHLSEALTEDTGVGNSVAGSPLPLSTGNENLDVALVIHLQYCNHLIQHLSSGGSVCQRRAQLRKLSAQTALLEELGEIGLETLGTITCPAQVLPGLAEHSSMLALWSEWSGSPGLFHTTLDRVLTHPHASDPVLRVVVGEMVDRCDLPPSPLSQDVLTVFQFHSYISQHAVQDMEAHLRQVAREAVFLEGLSSGDVARCVCELEEVCVSALRPRQPTLRALAALLTSDDPELHAAATAFMTSAAAHTPFRIMAVECYTQALSEAGVQTQRNACAALSILQAVESIKDVVSLCDSADEELRHVAIETLLTFGEEGRLAYEQMDTMPGELLRLGTRRGNAVTTAF